MVGKKQDGTITVFLSIILLAVVILAGVIVDAARINVAKPEIQRAVETSLRSSLAGYYKPLKEQYGLYALNENNDEKLEKIITDYLSKNLMINKEYLDEAKIGNYVDLFDYEIESIKVQPIFNLTENPATTQQILEYMKYRAPKEFVQDFLSKVKSLKKAGSTSEALKEKIDFEKQLKGIDNIQREIYKNIYGKYEKRTFYIWSSVNTLKYFVRKLDEKEFTKLIDEYIDAVKTYKDLKEDLKNSKEKTAEDKRRLRIKIEKAKKKIQKKYNEMIKEINQYDYVNKSADKSIDELIGKSKDIQKKLYEYKTYLKENKNNIIEDSYQQLMQEVSSYEKSISYDDTGEAQDNLNGIKAALNKNIECLMNKKTESGSVISLIEKLSPDKAKYQVSYIESVKKDIIDKIEAYNNKIEYDYLIIKKDEDYKEYDKREENQDKGNKRVRIDGKEKNQKGIVIEDKEYSILPSVFKSKTNKIASNNGINFILKQNNSLNQNDNENKDIEFYQEEQSGFSESAFSFINQITEKIDFANIRDKIYVNEYIMGTFKNAVTDIDKEVNLRNTKKSEIDTYFKTAEVEYVLNGNRSEKINQTLMDSKILLIRFGLNSIYIFTCKEKTNTADLIAAAVAGWCTGGAGIPIIRTLILLGWSMDEALCDLDELKSGGDVPLYKTEESWKTDWKSNSKKSCISKANNEMDEKSSSNKTGILDTSYQDYLRFFLLVQDKDKTIERVQDLIQLNMQKTTGVSDLKLNGFNTYVRIEVVASIKYLFLTQNFMPKEFKTEKNRHKFKVIIYQGY